MSNVAPLEAADLRTTARKVHDWPNAATLWDIGDGAAVFELSRADALISPEVITALCAAQTRVAEGFASLILTSSDPRVFAFGAAGPFGHTIRTVDTAPTLAFLLEGQAALLAMRRTPFPVVVAVHGVAFSGACEVALFANGLVVEETAPIALKEIWVGLIPGWGGCCQLQLRHQRAGMDALSAAEAALTLCAHGHIATGEAEGRRNNLLAARDRTVSDRSQLIPQAKVLANELVGTTAHAEALLELPPVSAASALEAHVARLDDALAFAPVEAAAMRALLAVLTDSLGQTIPESQYMAREAHAFLPLLKPSLGPRFAHLAATGQRPPRDA